MVSIHTRCAGPVAPLVAVLAGCLALAGCGLVGRELEPGVYRAVLELPAGELPFGLDVAREDDALVLYLVNGERRIAVTGATVSEGRLTATLPGTGNVLTAQVRGGSLEGEVTLGAGAGARVLPLRAQAGQAWRFFETPSTDNADVSGRWTVTIEGDASDTESGVAEFEQSFERVAGTLVMAAGKSLELAGEVQGDTLHLSWFDGETALLLSARVDEDGGLVGEFSTATSDRRTFRAARD